AAVTLTDSGTITFNSGDDVSFSYAPTAPIVVTNGGVLKAISTTFTGYNASNQTQIFVNSGGHFIASGSSFTFIQLYLHNGSLLKSGDIIGNAFNQTTFIPAIQAALLADNLVFNDVVIIPGSLSTGQVATLAPLGQSGTQRYVFNSTTGNFTIQAGASLNVAPSANVVAVETSGTAFGIVVNGVLNVADAYLT